MVWGMGLGILQMSSKPPWLTLLKCAPPCFFFSLKQTKTKHKTELGSESHWD